MTRPLCFLVVLAVLAGPAMAASFNGKVREANRLFEDGASDQAIAAYRALQTERPDVAILPFNIGCAAFENGMTRRNAQESDQALAAFDESRAAFERAVAVGKGDERVQARFNAANALRERARTLQDASRLPEAIQAYETAVRDYEEMLREYPGHAPARQNLAHTRFQWKELLRQQQESPEEEQQDDGQEDEEQQDQPQPVASIPRAETDLPDATVQTSTGDSSATVRLVVPQREGGQ